MKRYGILGSALLLCVMLASGGCRNEQAEINKVNEKLSSDIKELQSRPITREMIQKSGGNWNNLTPTDRQRFADEVSKGNQVGAQMIFEGAIRQPQGSTSP